MLKKGNTLVMLIVFGFVLLSMVLVIWVYLRQGGGSSQTTSLPSKAEEPTTVDNTNVNPMAQTYDNPFNANQTGNPFPSPNNPF